jgi:hypothetical protein
VPIERNYRPPPTGNLVTDVALRQILDHIYDLRNSYGPTNVFGKGAPNALPVTVPDGSTQPASAIGVSVTLDRPGNWLLTAAVALTIAGDPAQVFTLSLASGPTAQAIVAQWNSATDGQVMLHQTWQIPTVKGGLNCRLLIIKDGGAGTSSVDPINSTLTGMWMGPL